MIFLEAKIKEESDETIDKKKNIYYHWNNNIYTFMLEQKYCSNIVHFYLCHVLLYLLLLL